MNFKGKKLLILAGAGVHSKVVRAAKEMGIYTIVTDYLEDSPAKKIADESWMIDIMDIDSIVAKCKETGVDGVVNFCIDPAQWPYYKICKELGLPCYGTEKEFEILTDKVAFKKFCKENNVDVIPDYSLADIEQNNAEYPIFIKPSMSRGSRGQFVCYNREEAIKAWREAEKESLDGNALCEKYMAGKQDLGTAFFVVDGEPYLVKFGDRFLGKEEDGLNKQVMCTRLPSSFSQKFEKSVSDRVKKMIKSLGVKYGPVFLQGFVDGNTVRYYDPARRMPGGDYDLMILTITIAAVGILLVAASAISGSPDNLNGQMIIGDDGFGKVTNVLSVAVIAPFFLFGFDVIPQAAEEINVPLKKLGRILILSIVLAVSFYALVVFAVGYAMNPSEIAASMNGSGLVTADAMAKVFNSSIMAKVLIIGGMCGIVTSWNSFLIGGSRAMFSMGESYMIPHVFAKLHKKFKTPIAALILIGLLSVASPFFGRKMLVWISDAASFACCVAYCMVAISFIVIRKKYPDMVRPYKIKNYWFIGIMAVILSGLMVVLYLIPGSTCSLTSEEWIITGGWTLLGIIFAVSCKIKYKDKFGSVTDENEFVAVKEKTEE